MKNTRYLFDETKQTPEGMVSVSQIQTFLSCRKKWAYGYIENLTPRVDRAYLTIGKLCHVGMQTAMQTKWAYRDSQWTWWRKRGLEAMREEYDRYCITTPHLEGEIPDFEQLWMDAESVFTQAFEEFQPWKYDIFTVKKNGVEAPALELHFVIPCPPSKGLHGFIDAILIDKETGFLWCVDYKFRKTLSPDEEEAYNIQNAVYTAACIKMGIPIAGTMTWQHVNTPAAEPQLLKMGGVSKAKIKTTWSKFAKFCLAHDIDPAPYEEEMCMKLADIEFYRATYEYRNETTVNSIMQTCVLPVAKEIKAAYGPRAKNFRSLYPWNCKMCQFQSLCQGELRDYDVEAIKLAEYAVRPSVKEADNKPIDTMTQPVL